MNKAMHRRLASHSSTPSPPDPLSPKKGRGGEIAIVSFKSNETSNLVLTRNVREDEAPLRACYSVIRAYLALAKSPVGVFDPFRGCKLHDPNFRNIADVG